LADSECAAWRQMARLLPNYRTTGDIKIGINATQVAHL